MTTKTDTPTPTRAKSVARAVWQLIPTVLEDLVQRLDETPETRATIVQALAEACALVDIGPTRDCWQPAAERAMRRLGEMWQLLAGSVLVHDASGMDEHVPGYLGTRGRCHPYRARQLAEAITGYLHVDLAMAGLPGFGYDAVVRDTLIGMATCLYVAMARHRLTPPEEQELACYQVALWRGYGAVYGGEND